MSAETRWTPAQIRGVTDTSTGGSSSVDEPEDGAWTEDLDVAIYGEQDWLIPGTGERPQSCGKWYPMEFCDEAGHLRFDTSRCQLRECPSCWTSWTGRRTVNIVTRLGAAREAAEEASGRRLIHGVVSPLEGSIQSKEEFYGALKDAYGLAKEHGIRGGVVVPHGYRLREETKEAFRAEIEVGEWEVSRDGGAWRWVREHERDWRDLAYWSPHFHIIGLGRDIEPGSPEDDGGWIFKNIRSLSRWGRTDRDAYDDMAKAARYLLSHVTFESGESKQSVRWFGSLAPAQFSPEEELSEGVWSLIQRYAEEVVGSGDDRSEGGSGEPEECPVDGCSGRLHSIYEAGEFLQGRRDDLEAEAERRLSAAFEWMIGDRPPPAGLKNPRTEAEGREALEALL